MEKDGLLTIGKIVGIHGVKGSVKVYSYAESHSIFDSVQKILIKDRNDDIREFRVTYSKPHKRVILMNFEGVSDCNQALKLVDSVLLFPKKDLPELDNDTWYWQDLVGLLVYTTDEIYLGCVTSIIKTGSNDVFVVKDNNKTDGVELLIPILASVVLSVNLDDKKIKVVLPEGLCSK